MITGRPSPGILKKQQRIFTNGIITIVLGKSKREIPVHKALLSSRSPYFRYILARPGSQMTSIALLDIDVDSFCRSLSWLYADCFTIPEEDEWMGLCKLWLLAERFQVPALQNKVIELISCRLYQRHLAALDLEVLHYVYDNTGPGSKLRLLFVHISMWYGNQDVFAQMLRDMPAVFHADYAEQQAVRAKRWVEEERMDAWDLTGFLLPEIETVTNDDILGVKDEENRKVEDEDETRCDSPMNKRQTKRKRAKEGDEEKSGDEECHVQ
ncbi:hypothetical protein EK21DRAFT_96923 [Setomelanomma holmii]|uniref:BTB domain-containing protein n=1 Tax=Setomelanomma holmii TaxID=210430 RepID=A0A9P4LRC7_9PLEO|nr:hypothetical protein EK21DRAFT_96923 [Setomelanomma holmii]